MTIEDSFQRTLDAPPRNRWLGGLFFGRRPHKWINTLYLCVLYLTVAAASFHAFYDKWGFRDVPQKGYVGESHYFFSQMLDGSAERPFIYRRLLIQVAAKIESALPDTVRQTAVRELEKKGWWERESWLSSLQISGDVRSQHLVAYALVYYACFGFLFLTLLLARSI